MASSSSSEKYQVFLSFRGLDTRYNFTDHFHKALCRKGIKTFIDDQLERGEKVLSSLQNAIKGSKIAVIIFSKNYASSRWCLQELEHILECKEMEEQIVIPVFYHVDPSDVRNLKGRFQEGFAVLEERFKGTSEILKRWKDALKEAASLSGWHIDKKRPESECIEEIVEYILERLKKLSPSDDENLVGIEKSISTIESLLCIGLEGVLIIGIWGMGGIGKTTLSRVVFNKNLRKFKCYFFENIREEESKNSSLTHLRKEFIGSIFGDKDTNDGLDERLKSNKVFIVFDDVSDPRQIEKLIKVDLRSLDSESRVIITSRNKHVLQNCGVNDSNIYEVKGLKNKDAHLLFGKHAFRQKGLTKDYMKLTEHVIKYSKGVPLALKVLGSFLQDREKKDWESEIEKLEKYPHSDIQSVLKISYDGLDDNQKYIFLDIACFYKGWSRSIVHDILDASKLNAQININVLVEMALITISDDVITMHDLLQEMGREIVRQESINDPSKRSRLWHHKDIANVLKKNLGTGAVQGIRLDIYKVSDESLDCHAVAKMHNLRFFTVYNSFKHDHNYANKLDGFKDPGSFSYDTTHDDSYANKLHGFEDLESFSYDITYFGWVEYPFKSLPTRFCAENLVRLEMRYSKVKHLWHGVQNLEKLKYINLSYSKYITNIPNLSRALELQMLILRGCSGLSKITSASSIQNLKKLVKLDLCFCTRLFTVPDGIQSKTLTFSGCSNLEIAPKISRKVEELDLSGTAIKEIPFIEYPSNLVRFDLSNCSTLQSLSRSSNMCKLKLLKYLSLQNCYKLEKLPNDFGDLEALEDLFVFGAVIREVPSSILNLKKIKSLSLSRSVYDQAAPMNWIMNSSSGSSSLESLSLEHCRITRLPDNLGKLSFLRKLNLIGNDFETISVNIKDLSNLENLNVSDCKMLQSLPELPRGLDVVAKNCSSLESISDPSFLFSNQSKKQIVDFSNCFKLDLWKFLPKEPCQGYCASICFPGNKVPEWFNIPNAGSFITLEQLPDWQNESSVLGFFICVSFYRVPGIWEINFECLIRIKDDMIEVYEGSLYDFGYLGTSSWSEDHLLLLYHRRLYKKWDPPDELRMKKMGNNKVFIEFKNKNHGPVKVKECGIHFLY